MESLEDRHVLAVSVAILGATEVVFSGDANDDTLLLEVDPLGRLGYREAAADPLNFDLDSATPGEQALTTASITALTVDLGEGLDFLEWNANNAFPYSGGAITATAESIAFNEPVAFVAETTLDGDMVEFADTVDSIHRPDFDGDGNVDSDDQAVILSNFGLAGPDVTRSDGDTDGDGDVDGHDLINTLLALGSTVARIDLDITATTSIAFDGGVGTRSTLTFLETHGTGTTTIAGGTVLADRLIHFDTPVLLENDLLISSLFHDVSFNNTVDALDDGNPETSSHSLNIETPDGNVRFARPVGLGETIPNSDAEGLRSLSVFSRERIDLGVGISRTSHDQLYDGNVELESSTSIIQTRSVTFKRDLGSDGSPRSLVIEQNPEITVPTPGTARFENSIGSGAPLNTLTINLGGRTEFLRSSPSGREIPINTISTQNYFDPVLLESDGEFTSHLDDINFHSTIDALDDGDATTSSVGFDLMARDVAIFHDSLGAAGTAMADPQGFEFITIDAFADAFIASPIIRTTLDQRYESQVWLSSDVTLQTRSVLFADQLDSEVDPSDLVIEQNPNLAVQPAGIARFENLVGSNNPLRNLSIHLGDRTEIFRSDGSPGQITTQSDLTFGDPLLLQQNTELRSDSGDITFDRTIDVVDDGVMGTSNAGLFVSTTGAVNLAAKAGAPELLNGEIGGNAFPDDGIAETLDSDPDGLASLEILAGEMLTLRDANQDNDPANRDMLVVGDITIDVLEASPISLAEGILVESGFSLLSTQGDVRLRAGDDVVIESGSTLLAGAAVGDGTNGRLVIRSDFGDNDTAGSTITTTNLTGDAVGTIGANGGVSMIAGPGEDIVQLQVERHRDGNALEIETKASADRVTLQFTADSNLGAAAGTSVRVDTGVNASDETDVVVFAHEQDTSPRNVVAEMLAGDGAITRWSGFGAEPIAMSDSQNLRVEAAERQLLAGSSAASATHHLRVDASSLSSENTIWLQPTNEPLPADLMDRGLPSQAAHAMAGIPMPVSNIVDPNQPRIELSDYDSAHLIGGSGRDLIVNNTPLPALVEGGAGDDTVLGGKSVDVVFAGSGNDVVSGNESGDFLFADTDLVNAPFPIEGMISPPPNGNLMTPPLDDVDLLMGGAGLNHAAQLGAGDQISGINGMLLDGGATKSVIEYLRAQIMPATPGNVDMLVDAAFFGIDGNLDGMFDPNGAGGDKVGLEQVGFDYGLVPTP